MAYCTRALAVLVFSWRLLSATALIDEQVAAFLSHDACVDQAGGCQSSFVQMRAAEVNVEEADNSAKEIQMALTDLWDGMDISEQQMDRVQAESVRPPLTRADGVLPSLLQSVHSHLPSWLMDFGNMLNPNFAVPRPTAKYVQILGLFDTGTNLLEKMLMLNFPELRAKSFRGSSPFIWKHANVGAQAIVNAMNRSLPNSSSVKDVVVIAMVRSPISNIVSLRKAPYNVQQCMQRSYDNMGEPCVGYVGDVHGSQDRGPQGTTVQHWPAKNFSSTMDVYNSYLRQYQELKNFGLFRDVLILKYEDLVLDPSFVMKQIANATGQELPADLLVMSLKAKNHGASMTRQEAVDKLNRRLYLNEFGQDQAGLEVLCKGLNRTLVKDFAEGSFRGKATRVPYTQDCDRLIGTPDEVPGELEDMGNDLTPFPELFTRAQS